jgi:hypothetical protein
MSTVKPRTNFVFHGALRSCAGLRAKIFTRWGELQLHVQDGDSRLVFAVAADPTGVAMQRNLRFSFFDCAF